MATMLLTTKGPHRCAPGSDYEHFFDVEGRSRRLVFTFDAAGSVCGCECGQHWRVIDCPGTGFARPRTWVKCSPGRARRMLRRAVK